MNRVPSSLGALALLTLAPPALAPAAVAAPGGAGVAVRDSAYGRILFDGGHRALYAFTRDRGARSACAGACAAAWPPDLVTARPSAGAGARASLLGTTRRADGRLQATYAGRPLYYYAGDGVGQVRCQNVYEYGGRWLVVRPSGRPVRGPGG